MVRDFAPTPYEPQPRGDESRPRQSWLRAILKVVLVVAVMPTLALGVYFLANTGEDGTIAFGDAGVLCRTAAADGLVAAGAPVFAAVFLERGFAPGEVLTVRLLRGTQIVSEVEVVVAAAGQCHTQRLDAGELEPGRYRVIAFAGEDLLADGDFEIVEATGRS